MSTKGPIKGNEHLHEEIETEEFYDECNCAAPCEGVVLCANCHGVLRNDHDHECSCKNGAKKKEDIILEAQKAHKRDFTQRIIEDLEDYLECDQEYWGEIEETKLIDILGAVENHIKACIEHHQKE